MLAKDTFNPRLFDEDDDEEYLAYKAILNNVITQTTPPSEAAAKMDEWVTIQANKRQAHVKDRELTEEENDSLYLVWPNPARHVEMITGSIARLCSAYPPGHAVQNALIEFTEALKRLPKHELPGLSYDMDHQAVLNGTYSMWPLGTGVFTGNLAKKFQTEAEDIAYPFSNVETPGSESQIRWRNLQAFVARLTTLGLIDCSEVSALSYILPGFYTYPDLEERKLGGPQRIEGDLVAASQWLMPDDVRKWVYEHCKVTDETWTMQKWAQWKEQLSFINGDELFGDEARALAGLLKEKMDGQEMENH